MDLLGASDHEAIDRLKTRNAIVGTQSELVRAYGLRHARYRGFAKAYLQNYLISAACNLRRLFRCLTWAAAQVTHACPARIAG